MSTKNEDLIVKEYCYDQDVMKKASRTVNQIIDTYGRDNVAAFVWGPNASYLSSIEPPQGFSFAVRADCPLNPSVFSRDKLFTSGISILQLTNSTKTENNSRITEEYLMRNSKELMHKMHEGIPERPGIDSPDIKKPSTDLEWEESLGKANSGSYCGVFASEERTPSGFKRDYWLVTQTAVPDISQQLYDLIEDTTPDHDSPIVSSKQTWGGFFNQKNQEINRASKIATKNRTRLLYNLVESLSLNQANITIDTDFGSSNSNSSSNRMMVNPTTDMGTNAVTPDPNNSKVLVYHSKTVNPIEMRGGGLIISENPFAGVTILRGPNASRSKVFGEKWSTAETSYGAFPTCTGRVTALNRRDLQPRRESESDGTILFSEQSSNSNLRLDPRVYRLRDEQFKRAEAALGYDHSWGQIYLRPVIVKISS